MIKQLKIIGSIVGMIACSVIIKMLTLPVVVTFIVVAALMGGVVFSIAAVSAGDSAEDNSSRDKT
jgi:hypothetical protein